MADCTDIDCVGKTVASAIEECLTKVKLERHSPGFVLSMLDEVFERGYFVSSMEVSEVKVDNLEHPRIDLGIYGLEPEWETRAASDANYARQLVEDYLSRALQCENKTICLIWLDKLNPSGSGKPR